MAPPSFPSPTSLLWAHQLKREHGYLLQRMQDLEAKSENQEARIKTVESTATKTSSSSEIADLAKQVTALNDAGIEKRITDMEKDVAEKIEEVQAESEAHTLQIASLQKDQDAAGEERMQAVSKDKALLKRIGEVEEGLQKYEKSLGRMGKRLDETRFEQIKGQLDGLTKQVQREGEQMKWLTESINALEAANAELKKANEKLETELGKMAAKAANAEKKKAEKVAAGGTADGESSSAAGGVGQEPPKKKSHKWAGGGADRDIIRMGSDLFGSPRSAQRSPYATTNKEPSKNKPDPPGPKKKPQPPPPKPQRVSSVDESDTPKKSHRWAGGGADRDIIQAGISQSVDAKGRRSSENVAEVSKKKPHRWSGGGADREIIQAGSSPASKAQPSHQQEIEIKKEKPKPKQPTRVPAADGNEIVVRAGKGWIEVAETQTAESNNTSISVAPPVKRKRGRPRKEQITPQFTEEELLQGRVTRRGNMHPIEQQQQHHADTGTSLVNEILGDLQHTPVAQEILKVEPSIERYKLVHLRELFDEDPRLRTDLKALMEKLDLNRQEANNKKRTVDSAFGAEAQNTEIDRIKKIKREEESPPPTVTRNRGDVVVVHSTATRPAERNESKAPVLGVISSQPEEVVVKPRRTISQFEEW